MRTGAVPFLCLAILALPGIACGQNPPPLQEKAPPNEKQILDKLTKMIKQVEPVRPTDPLPVPTPPKVDLPPAGPPAPGRPAPPLAQSLVPTQPPSLDSPPQLPPTPIIPSQEGNARPVEPTTPPPEKPAIPTPPYVMLRVVLNKNVTLNHVAKDLVEAVAHLRERTGIHFVLDPAVRAADANRSPVVLKATEVPLSSALNAVLTQHRLGYAVVGETIFITTERSADNLRLRQLVHFEVNGVPLKTVVQQLSAYSGVNVVIDPRLRSTKVENEPITLSVPHDVAVHNAVRLLAEFANLKAVPVGNVLVITTPEYAARINEVRPSQNVVGVSGVAVEY
jgi:hypothetical protein